jgi:methanogen extracellular protein (TIGR04279 family)
LKKKSGICRGISGRKWRVTWILLILVFSIISASATGADNSTKSHASDVVDISEQNTNSSNVVDITYQNTNSSAGVDDPEPKTNVSNVVDDPEQNTDESNVVDDPEQNTDESNVVDDPEPKTNVNNVVDDPEPKTNSSNVVDDPEPKTNVSNVVDDPEPKTNVSNVVDDPEQNTDESNVADDPEQNTDESNVIDDPKQNTDESNVVDYQKQKTDASTRVDCQESSKVNSEQKKDANNEHCIGAKTESKTEAYNGTKSLESGEVSPEIKVYNWNDSAGNEAVIPEIKAEGSSWNNLKRIQSYPYSLRSFYAVNESVKIIYRGPETLSQQNINIYLVKEKSPYLPENAISNGINESTITLEDVFNNNTESYIQIPATLNKDGDLSPLTVGPLRAGSYWVLITLAGNETEEPESEKEILLANDFEVLKYELEAVVPYTLEEGESFEVNLNLKNAPSQKNYTYWAVLIREDAYTTYEGTNPDSMNAGIRPIVNGIDIIRSLETSLIESESETGKGELESNIQTLLGKGNGMISIGEKNQSTLSLKSFELPPGDYLLLAGACENDEGLAGIAQKKLRISTENSHGSGLKSSSGNQIFGNISPRTYTVSPFLGINPHLETPDVFISKDIKPYIQARASVEVVRNPPKIPSFLLGFSGTLLIGLAVLRKYR